MIGPAINRGGVEHYLYGPVRHYTAVSGFRPPGHNLHGEDYVFLQPRSSRGAASSMSIMGISSLTG